MQQGGSRHPHKYPHNFLARTPISALSTGVRCCSSGFDPGIKSFPINPLASTPEYFWTLQRTRKSHLITQRSKVQILPPQPNLTRLFLAFPLQNQTVTGRVADRRRGRPLLAFSPFFPALRFGVTPKSHQSFGP